MLDEKFVQEAVKTAVQEIAKKELVALVKKAVGEYLDAELDSKVEDSLDIQNIADQVRDEMNLEEFNDLDERIEELENKMDKIKDAVS